MYFILRCPTSSNISVRRGSSSRILPESLKSDDCVGRSHDRWRSLCWRRIPRVSVREQYFFGHGISKNEILYHKYYSLLWITFHVMQHNPDFILCNYSSFYFFERDN